MEKTAFGNTVALSRIDSYNIETLSAIIREHFNALGLSESFFTGKRVVVKPNLVMKKSPDAAATTHPAVLCAVLSVLRDFGVTPLIAESPGGIYNRQRLEGIYRACGIEEAARAYGAALNVDTTSVGMAFPDGRKVKMFNIITPIAEADIIFDLCKLKSHSLTKMSAAVKNLFGTIPGIEKFEMHATFPDYGDFGAMLCDLCAMLCSQKKVIAVTDAVVGMEGNGPTAGTPRKIGAILTSDNPFASDLAAEKLIGFTGTVPLVREAVSRGFCPSDISGLAVIGNASIEELALSDFKEPDSAKNKSTSALAFFSRGRMGRFFMPRPVASSKKCRGCGECVASCPKHTIELVERSGVKIAHIRHASCIRCYCCQELCPFGAIQVKKNLLIRLISSI